MKWNKDDRIHFDQFRSGVCHLLKSMGDVDFVELIVKENWIELFWNFGWKKESLYMLAMLDYLSDLYNVPPFSYYDPFRLQKMEYTVFPQSVLIEDKIWPNKHIKEEVVKKCTLDPISKYFVKYNIVEGDIRDVV